MTNVSIGPQRFEMKLEEFVKRGMVAQESVNRIIERHKRKVRRIKRQIKRLEEECPYAKNPAPIGSGVCEWCGEDHWKGG